MVTVPAPGLWTLLFSSSDVPVDGGGCAPSAIFQHRTLSNENNYQAWCVRLRSKNFAELMGTRVGVDLSGLKLAKRNEKIN